MKLLKKIIRAIYKSLKNKAWVSTLIATMLGVLFAFYLDNKNTESKDKKRHDAILLNIKQELTFNYNKIKESHNDSLVNFLSVYNNVVNQEDKILLSTNQFKETFKNYSAYYKVIDAIKLNDSTNSYNISRQVPFNLTVSNTIVWETAKLSNFANEISFDCLTTIVNLYTLSNKIKENENEFLKQSDDLEQAKQYLEFSSQFREIFLKEYKKDFKILKNCDSN